MRPWYLSALLTLWLVTGPLLAAQVTVSGKVLDDNGVAVPGARVELRHAASELRAPAVADIAGSFTVELQQPGEYQLRVERHGFFVLAGKSVRFEPGANQLVINVNRLQEFAESIDVTYSLAAIDYQETADQKQLESVEILTVPYAGSRDLRNALPLMNGVVQDNAGRLHFNGAATDQTNFTLDGFHISDPVTGRFEARMNIYTVQSLELESGRFSAEKGRGSAGTLDIKTKMGDDRWRFGAASFFPGVSTENGLHVDKWSPQLTFSGPLVAGRAWFHNAWDGNYDIEVVRELPRGRNRKRGLSTNNLSHFQVNLTPANILTGSFLANYSDTNNLGLSFLDPVETTTNRNQNLYMYTVKDQMYFHGGALVELGFADTRGVLRQIPHGDEVFEITPLGRRGNYFVHLDRHTRRQEGMVNAFLPPLQAYGAHQLKVGFDIERDAFHQSVDRHGYRVLRNDWSLVRSVSFDGNRFQQRNNLEASQYVQDRWSPHDGLLIEAGLRADWNQIVREVLWSPRFSFAWAPKPLRDTKIAGGYGIFYDALALGTLAQHQDQDSYSTFYMPNGTVRGPVITSFLANEQALRVPRYRTLSLTVERKLPLGLHGKVAYIHKVGTRGFMFVNDLPHAPGDVPQGGMYHLRNWRHDRYDGLEIAVRRTFAGQFEWSAGYTRSSARANAVVNYSVENPIFAQQAPGPYAWDTPNRFLMWGWAPFPKRLLPGALRFLVRETSAAYLIEYRTGFPFDVVNEEGVLVGRPNARRLPSYMNLNLHFERRFHFFHHLWAWRLGFNNLTNSGNPNNVNNNIDSPGFLTYGRGQVRAFAVRLRFLGKR